MSSRYECTAREPWGKGKGRAYHPDADEIGEQQDGWPGGDLVTYECPHCGLKFQVELPQ